MNVTRIASFIQNIGNALKGGETGMKEYIMKVADNGMVTKVEQELVRCKDCKHRNTIFCFKDEQGFGTDDDWFCADGERR